MPLVALVGTPAADRVGEIVVAVATIIAVVLLALTLPALLRRGRGRAGVTPALVILTAAAAITFVAYLAFVVRCGEARCGFDSGDTILGFGPWWRTGDAWQWGAQLALAGLGLALASLALALAARHRRGTGRAVVLARVAVGIWVVVAFLIPAAWEVFAID